MNCWLNGNANWRDPPESQLEIEGENPRRNRTTNPEASSTLTQLATEAALFAGCGFFFLVTMLIAG